MARAPPAASGSDGGYGFVNAGFRGFVSALRFIAAATVVVCFAYMTIAVLAQVFGRYLFNYSISWTEETARFAQIWVVFIGAGIAMRRGWHVAVDALPSMLSLGLARAVSVVVAVACIGFLGIVAFGSLPLIEIGWMFELSPVLQVPMWIVYLCIPLGAFYFAFEIALSVVDRWNRPYGPSASAGRPGEEQA